MIKKPHILLVEDQLIGRITAKGLLEHAGCEVKTAENGNAAIKLAQETQFDLIFMDLGLPDMDGFAVTSAIRALPEPFGKSPIVALTAHDDKEVEKHAYEVGMQAFLTKPLDEAKVKDMMTKFIRNR